MLILSSKKILSCFFFNCYKLLQFSKVLSCKFKRLSIKVHTEGFNASVVDVMALVKDYNTVILKLIGDQISNFWVKQISVIINNNVSL